MSDYPGVLMFNAQGQVHCPRIWVGSVVTNNGAWTVDYSTAGFTEAPFVTAMPEKSAANVEDRAFASLSGTPTANSASGYAVQGRGVLVGGVTLTSVPNGTKIWIMAIGSTHAD